MYQQEQNAALILLSAAQHILTERRKTEMMCGYPPEYGGDELLIKRINEFLGNPEIAHEVKEALEFSKKFKDE